MDQPIRTRGVPRGRYVADAQAHFARLRKAAEAYPEAVRDDVGLEWMQQKPYDRTPGHHDFFGPMYAVMNALQAMRLPAGALVMEVGSGPGWLTQILAGLGYRVLAIEPSAGMVALAEARLEAFGRMVPVPAGRVTHLVATLEEADLAAHAGTADGVLFHEALHHVIDEAVALRQVLQVLKPGGCLAVCGEARWQPGDLSVEDGLEAEMRRYGTLESPFTRDYLEQALAEAGFVDVTFFHSINGFFPEAIESLPIRQVAKPSSLASNSLIARRPLSGGKGQVAAAATDRAATAGRIHVLSRRWEGSRCHVTLQVANDGATMWPAHQPPSRPGVTVTLCDAGPAEPPREAANRCDLPADLYPGDKLELSWTFEAAGLDPARCCLRLIVEEAYWMPGPAAPV